MKSDKPKLQAVRGMNDILPHETPRWQAVEALARELLAAYGYSEIRMPLVESVALFRRGIGQATDIVEKEMYEFPDRNGEALALRPEGTASCVRAVLEHALLRERPVQRLWYAGPMFRHERPQAGRYRQFHQIGVETFGMAGPGIDAELIELSARLWQGLGITGLRLELNTLGTAESRAAYREALVAYFEAHRDALDEDSQRRLLTNPLRILDSKNPALAEVIAAAPSFADYLDADSAQHFAGLQALLQAAGIPYVLNPRLVRGLDYYSRTVFEWVTDTLGAQGTVCAGGRYDGLISEFGGQATPAVGFAIGLERLLALMLSVQGEGASSTADVYVVCAGAEAERLGLRLADQLRQGVPGLRVVVDCTGAALGKQFKRADQSGATRALVLGDDEIKAQRITCKALREAELSQSSIEISELLTVAATWARTGLPPTHSA